MSYVMSVINLVLDITKEKLSNQMMSNHLKKIYTTFIILFRFVFHYVKIGFTTVVPKYSVVLFDKGFSK